MMGDSLCLTPNVCILDMNTRRLWAPGSELGARGLGMIKKGEGLGADC